MDTADEEFDAFFRARTKSLLRGETYPALAGVDGELVAYEG
jgi:hypothetical protein